MDIYEKTRIFEDYYNTLGKDIKKLETFVSFLNISKSDRKMLNKSLSKLKKARKKMVSDKKDEYISDVLKLDKLFKKNE